VLIGISFVDENTGYMSGGQNGQPPVGGPQGYRSDDAGENWTWLPHQGAAAMFLDTAAWTKTSAVVAGVAITRFIPGIEYTRNGQFWNRSTELETMDECQSAERVSGIPGGFGLAGVFDVSNGVAISWDGGNRFTHYDANITFDARYGYYPSRTVFYVSAGMWPGKQRRQVGSGVHDLTQRIQIHRTADANGVLAHRVKFDFDVAGKKSADGDTYHCELAKTEDAGKTWKTTYHSEDFYPNGISCPTINSCWVVGEALHDSPKPGVRILHTGDGGKTWDVQLYNPNPHYSLLAVEFINENEGWAAGGELSALHFMGHFWHTINGGKNWTLNEVPQVYGNDMSFINKNRGWATAFTIHEESAVMAYK